MSINFGNINLKDLRLGTFFIYKVFSGVNLVWERQYKKLVISEIEAANSNSFNVTVYNDNPISLKGNLQFSQDYGVTYRFIVSKQLSLFGSKFYSAAISGSPVTHVRIHTQELGEYDTKTIIPT